MKNKFKVGDKVILNGCPFDEQIVEEMEEYIPLVGKVQVVTELGIRDEGHLLRTNKMKDWTADIWFKSAQDVMNYLKRYRLK